MAEVTGLKVLGQWDGTEITKGLEELKKQFSSFKGFNVGGTGGGGGLGEMGKQAKNTKSVLDELRRTVKNLENAAISSAIENGKNAQSTVGLRNAYAAYKAILNETTKTVRNSTDAYGRLSDLTNRATRHAQNLGAIYGTNSEQFKNAADRAKALTERLKEIDAAVGRNFRNVGNYASGYNGLSVSMSRILGELPNAAISSRIFFQAISNNLQPLKESIDEVIKKNKELRAEGKPTKSAFSQVASSLFSLNTLFLAGVGLLTAYGPKLTDWISSLGDAGKALINTKAEQKELNKAQEDATKQAGNVIGKLYSLNGVLMSNTANARAKKGAYDELIKQYPSYAQQLHDEYVKTGNVANVIKNVLVPAIIAAARARAYESRITDLATKAAALADPLEAKAKEYKKLEAAVAPTAKKLGVTVEKYITDQFNAASKAATGGSWNQPFDDAALAAGQARFELGLLQKQYDFLSNGISDYQKKIGEVTPAMGNISSQFEDTGKHVDKTKAKVNEVSKAIEDYKNAIAGLENRLEKELIAPHKAAEERVKILTDAFDKLTGDLKQSPNSPFVQQIISDLVKANEKLSVFNAEARRLDPDLWKRTSQTMGEMLDQWREPLEEDKIRKLEKLLQLDPTKALKDAKAPEQVKQYFDGINKQVAEAAKKTKESADKLRDSFVSLGVGIGESIGNEIGEALSGGKFKFVDVLNEILHLIGQFVVDYGKELIKVGALLVTTGTLLSEFGGAALVRKGLKNIAVGGLLVIGGGILKTVNIGKNRRAMADGGLLYGPTDVLAGEYPGASSNPEVFAPLDKLKSMLGDTRGQVVVLESRISGQDILLSQKRAERYNNR
ncbi:MAG: hypothetical protein J7599_07475 [Niabella sp.]|nr:hypothetical protein [Niabella sp.]